jgi:hypothetical protein
MSITAIREAYLQRVAQARRGTGGPGAGRCGRRLRSPPALPFPLASRPTTQPTHPPSCPQIEPPIPCPQDIQEESARSGAPPLSRDLLTGELAKLQEELGDELEADWAAAAEALTTTGRARREGGAATLMPRPQPLGVR